ncbi:MAG: hypothetical protein ABSE97_00015 [Verrucomicrobiota bacterium]|jgi:hypothetical protein
MKDTIDTIESIRSFVSGLFCCVGLIFLIVMFIKGGAWLSERVYPWLVIVNAITLSIVILVLLPLAIFHRTRGFAAGAMYITSYVFGLTLWVWSLLISYTLWGVVAVIFGLILTPMGVGVVPIAILASLFHGLWSIVGQLFLIAATMCGVGQLGIYLIIKSEDHGHTPPMKADQSSVK